MSLKEDGGPSAVNAVYEEQDGQPEWCNGEDEEGGAMIRVSCEAEYLPIHFDHTYTQIQASSEKAMHWASV